MTLTEHGQVKLQFKCGIGSAIFQDGPTHLATIRYNEFDPAFLEVELLEIADDGDWVSPTRFGVWENPLLLTPMEPGYGAVMLFGDLGPYLRTPRVLISPDAISLGVITHRNDESSHWYLSAKLLPAEILNFYAATELDEDSPISVPVSKHGYLEFDSSFGRLKLHSTKSGYSGREFDHPVTYLVHRATAQGKVTVPGGTSVQEAMEKIRDEIHLACKCLTLVYRWPISFYEISFQPLMSESSSRYRQNVTFRVAHSPLARKSNTFPLVPFHYLEGEGFNSLYSALDQSEERDLICRVIEFLAGSHDAHLETAYFMAFAALETMVILSAASEEPGPLGTGERKRICRALRKTIDEFVPQNSREVMKRKLPELFRPPFADLALLACGRTQVSTDDLWVEEGLEKGLKVAMKTRNELFHALEVSDPQRMAMDFYRIRILAERMILSHLKWPISKTEMDPGGYLGWANSSTGSN